MALKAYFVAISFFSTHSRKYEIIFMANTHTLDGLLCVRMKTSVLPLFLLCFIAK